jgi:hypothetical protein
MVGHCVEVPCNPDREAEMTEREHDRRRGSGWYAILGLALLTVSGCGGSSVNAATDGPTTTADTGTAVRRGSQVETTTTEASPRPGSGIAGAVYRSACGSQVDCAAPPEPVAAEVRVSRADAAAVIGSAHTNSVGRFQVAVPPGDYQVRAKPDHASILCEPSAVTVADGFTEITLTCS